MRRALFILTIFISSGLLFLVEPLVAKMILPAFGGSPAVWTASMVFFQGTLLLGYIYAHLSTKWLGLRRQPLAHIGLMAIALLTLPFTLPAGQGATSTANPTPSLLYSLAVMVGAAFFCISAGAPLIQRWFSVTDDPDAKDPYFLYSASNLASLIALLAYPIFVEPHLRLGQQSKFWSWGYGGLLAVTGLCAWLTLKSKPSESPEVHAKVEISWRQRGLWIALAAVPSSLLLGVTSFLTTNIAPIPLLLVIPLSLYLLTFILAFAKKQIWNATILGRVAPLLAIPLALMVVLESDKPIEPIAFFHLVTFFLLAWMCHSRLNESRPAVGGLTEFYVWISVGGVVGGLFNAIVAPAVFSSLIEYPVALVAAVMLRPMIVGKKGLPNWVWPVAVGLLGIAGDFITSRMGMPASTSRTLLTIGVPLIVCMFAVDQPIWFGLSLGMVFVVSSFIPAADGNTVVFKGRSFFGVHSVATAYNGRFVKLRHGNTLHGMQDREHPEVPLTYYHPTGPIGHVFTAFSGDKAKDNVALVGMGVGSLAAYGQPGEHMDFYEIDPVVWSIARNPKYFTFLKDCKADLRVVMGDARLRLAEAPSHKYGLIVLDAFSSDAIPIHLLTKEAFEMYLSKLESNGVIAVHISNRYLDLEPVLSALAKDLHMQIKGFTDGITTDERDAGKTESSWLVLARKEGDFGDINADHNWGEVETWDDQPVWTDDYSNVLGVFRTDR